MSDNKIFFKIVTKAGGNCLRLVSSPQCLLEVDQACKWEMIPDPNDGGGGCVEKIWKVATNLPGPNWREWVVEAAAMPQWAIVLLVVLLIFVVLGGLGWAGYVAHKKGLCLDFSVAFATVMVRFRAVFGGATKTTTATNEVVEV